MDHDYCSYIRGWISSIIKAYLSSNYRLYLGFIALGFRSKRAKLFLRLIAI